MTTFHFYIHFLSTTFAAFKHLSQITMLSYILGWFLFLFIFLMGFSMLIFLSLFVGYWITLVSIEKVSPSLAHKIIGYKEEEA